MNRIDTETVQAAVAKHDARSSIIRSPTVIGAIALVAVSAAVTMSGPNRLTDVVRIPPLRHACSQSAREQLPADLVDKVEEERFAHRIPVGDDNSELTYRYETKTIRSGGTYNGWRNSAEVTFNADFCGFQGSLVMEQTARHAASENSGHAFDRDKEVITRNGKPFNQDPNSGERLVCFSDTVPTAEIIKGALVIKISCDRAYNAGQLQTAYPLLEPR